MFLLKQFGVVLARSPAFVRRCVGPSSATELKHTFATGLRLGCRVNMHPNCNPGNSWVDVGEALPEWPPLDKFPDPIMRHHDVRSQYCKGWGIRFDALAEREGTVIVLTRYHAMQFLKLLCVHQQSGPYRVSLVYQPLYARGLLRKPGTNLQNDDTGGYTTLLRIGSGRPYGQCYHQGRTATYPG